jgi:hypothetical protein
MKKLSLGIVLGLSAMSFAQTNPAITAWLQNTTGIMGSHYVSGNPTVINDAVEANVQTVQYSANWAYITTNGIPAYPTGPFLDGNPSLATDQNAIFKFPLNPTQNTGALTSTTGGNIGVFINGVALFDYRDGVAWNTSTSSLCGGLPGMSPFPGGPATSQSWNRDAVPAEKLGFDCSKGHPANGNYHHHQNPSAFNLDLTVISTICDIYAADGLYAINPAEHSPLIGFAYDGFPIYGAYGYANANGTGGIVRIKSGYQFRNITDRTVWADGTDVADGPIVSTTYPLGYFREDYEFIAHPSDPSYLDAHNGRICNTPEYPISLYPNGIYCYFATVDVNHNSAYPYVVGPYFYGNKTAAKVTSITEAVTTYTSVSNVNEITTTTFNIFPNPTADVLIVQSSGLQEGNIIAELVDATGKSIQTQTIYQGSTICYFNVSTLYSGTYFIKISNGQLTKSYSVIIAE